MTELRYYASEKVFGEVKYFAKIDQTEMDVTKEESLSRLREKLQSLNQTGVTLVNGSDEKILYWHRPLTSQEERDFLNRLGNIKNDSRYNMGSCLK